MGAKAIYPGSFDPFTQGHKEIVDKALLIFDHVVIAIGYNIAKSGHFSLEKRIELIQKVYANNPRVSIVSYTGLTSVYCAQNGISHIIRGLRNGKDFSYEKEIALVNKSLDHSIETVFLLSDSDKSLISSSTVRELLCFGADPMQFMPKELTIDDLKE